MSDEVKLSPTEELQKRFRELDLASNSIEAYELLRDMLKRIDSLERYASEMQHLFLTSQGMTRIEWPAKISKDAIENMLRKKAYFHGVDYYGDFARWAK